MTTTLSQTRLFSQLADMIALEAAIEQRLEELISAVAGYAIVSTLFEGFRTLSRDHRQALKSRLAYLIGKEPPAGETATIYAADNAPNAAEYPVSSSLQEIYTLHNRALIGYAVLGTLASHELDSSCIADEGTSAHLAVQHTNDYVRIIRRVSRLINDVVIWELDYDGAECRCCCPSCSAGICLCAAWWRNVLSDACLEAGPIANDVGIYVQHPKRGSAATQAGLVRGDVILAVEGGEIESLGDIQSAVRNSQPGEVIQLMVRRHSDALENIKLVYP